MHLLLVVLALTSVLGCGALDYNLAQHHNNDEILDLMLQVHDECPNITYVYFLEGPSNTTALGRHLPVIVFSDNPQQHELGEWQLTGNINRIFRIEIISLST